MKYTHYSELLQLFWVHLFVIPETIAHQVPLSTEFSRQELWNELQFPPPGDHLKSHLLWLLPLQADSLQVCHLASPVSYSRYTNSINEVSPLSSEKVLNIIQGRHGRIGFLKGTLWY